MLLNVVCRVESFHVSLHAGKFTKKIYLKQKTNLEPYCVCVCVYRNRLYQFIIVSSGAEQTRRGVVLDCKISI